MSIFNKFKYPLKVNTLYKIIKMTAYFSFIGLLIQILFFNSLFASTASGQDLRDVKVTISAHNVTLEQALMQIEQNTSFNFVYNNSEIPLEENVTIDAEGETLYNLLQSLSGQYNLVFKRINNQIVIKKRETPKVIESSPLPKTGGIKGKIIDASTSNPLIGATIMLKGTSTGTTSDKNGNYSLDDLLPGNYTVIVSYVGYGKIGQDVVVKSNKVTDINIYLSPSAVGLDDIVVTGVSSETQRREIPADISVITSKEIEEKNPLNFTDAIKGEIPGLFALSNGQLNYSSAIYIRGRSYAMGGVPALPMGTPSLINQEASGGVDAAKILIDGVEVANSSLLSTIDPNSIERIEVIRGPHAAALYGSQAMSGIVQIITKKGYNYGLNRPRVSASFAEGYIQSSYTASGDFPSQTNANVQISNGGDIGSYNVGLSYDETGPWLPNNKSKKTNVYSGFHTVMGGLSASLTGSYGHRTFNYPANTYIYDRWPGLVSAPYRPDGAMYGKAYPNSEFTFNEFTLALNLNYIPVKNWTNNLVIGMDNSSQEERQLTPYYNSPTDTTHYLNKHIYNRRSLRFNSGYKINLSSNFSASVILGAEYQDYTYTNSRAKGILFNEYGDILKSPAGTESFTNNDYWYAGFNGMVELGYLDKLFLSVTVSDKQDPRGYKLNYVAPPNFGISYNDNLGFLKYRIRGQYGTSIQPVDPARAQGSVSSYAIYLPNPGLVPSKRTGWEAGFELYYAHDASLTFTYFAEKSEDEILPEPIDLTQTPRVYQFQNLGSCKIDGIELGFNWNLRSIGLPLDFKFNYSYANNVMTSTSDLYKPSPVSPIETGDRVFLTPKNSGGASLSGRFGKLGLILNCQFSGGWRNYDWAGWNDYRYGNAKHRDAGDTYANLPMIIKVDGQNIYKMMITRSYIIDYPTYFKFGFRGNYKVSSLLTVFLVVDNIFNDQVSDVSNMYVAPGRTTSLGIKINY